MSRPAAAVTVRPFRDPDPFHELTFASPLAARRAIAVEIRLPLAKLSDDDRAFIDALLTRTLARAEILANHRIDIDEGEGRSNVMSVAPRAIGAGTEIGRATP
jgi:hypothetical protein